MKSAVEPQEVTEEQESKTSSSKTPKAKGKSSRRLSAEAMASRQREISVSEFFTKNRHLLGFDNPAKALLTTVKEAVDNSLDACEEAGILPNLRILLQEMGEDRYRVIVEDNGPGIIKQQIPKIFGKLLYGSKFHRLKQSRGQQGIGISAAGMYGQLTTGRAMVITSRTNPKRPANQFEIVLNTRKNAPEIIAERDMDWQVDHGTRVEIELQGNYKAGRNSVDAYLEQVAIANPHAEIFYAPPKGKPPIHLPRASETLPQEPMEIKPHPHGVELGMLMKLIKDSKQPSVSTTLQKDFSRVTDRVAEQICELAEVKPRAKPRNLPLEDIERLYKAIPQIKIMAPPTNCVVPIGEDLIRKGLEREIKADLYVSSTRPPSVYRGNPFRVEVGLAYGGELRTEKEEEDPSLLDLKNDNRTQGPITLIRFANRVPLQYQQSACAIFRGVVESNWKIYGLPQPKGSLPHAPMVLFVHLASVWVPFTSESKEAIAHYPEILKEIKLGLRECGRKLATFLRRKERSLLAAKRRSIFIIYIGELAKALGKLTSKDEDKIQRKLMTLAERHSGGPELADAGGVTPTKGTPSQNPPVDESNENEDASDDSQAAGDQSAAASGDDAETDSQVAASVAKGKTPKKAAAKLATDKKTSLQNTTRDTPSASTAHRNKGTESEKSNVRSIKSALNGDAVQQTSLFEVEPAAVGKGAKTRSKQQSGGVKRPARSSKTAKSTSKKAKGAKQAESGSGYSQGAMSFPFLAVDTSEPFEFASSNSKTKRTGGASKNQKVPPSKAAPAKGRKSKSRSKKKR